MLASCPSSLRCGLRATRPAPHTVHVPRLSGTSSRPPGVNAVPSWRSPSLGATGTAARPWPVAQRTSNMIRRAAAVDEQPAGDNEVEDDMDYVDWLNAMYGLEELVHFTWGEGGQPRVWLRHPFSSMGIEVYLHGATVTRWLRPDGKAALDSSPDAVFNSTSPIKGGLRIVFPQYREGLLVENGFAGRLQWEVAAAGLNFLNVCDGLHRDKWDAAIKAWKAASDKLEAQGVDLEAMGAAAASDAHLLQAMQEAAEATIDHRLPVEEEEEEEGEEGEGEDVEAGALAGGDAEGAEGVQGEATTGASSTQVGQEEEEEEGGEQVAEDVEEGQGEAAGAQVGPSEGAVELDPVTFEILAKLAEGYDPAPFVTLRLTDSDETRRMGWPHKFELLLKLTVSEEDEFDTPEFGPEDSELMSTASLAVMDEEDTAAATARARHRAAQARAMQRRRPAAGRIDPETGEAVPVQLRVEMVLRNLDDPETAPPMAFQAAALANFAVRDVLRHGELVKVLGLGASTILDYSGDDRQAIMTTFNHDFVHFTGHRIETVHVGAAKRDVKFTPGDGTHMQLITRKGFKDVVVSHPGINPTMVMDPNRQLAGLGVGHLVVPTMLAAGDMWEGELVIRYHDTFWTDHVGTVGEMPPMLNMSRREAGMVDPVLASTFTALGDDDEFASTEEGEEEGAA